MIAFRMRRLGVLFALCFGAIGTTAAATDDDAYYYLRGTSLPSQATWMSTLDDATPLNLLSIPGTHASAGWEHDFLRYYSQALPIRQQLDGGIRFLDLGVRGDGDDVRVSDNGKAFMRLQDAVVEVGAFLADHPSETVFVHLHQDDTINSNGRDLPNLVNQFAQEFAFISPAEGLKINAPLGSVRGKIVWLREPGVILPGLDIGLFSRQNHAYVDVPWALYSKWEKVKAQFDLANRTAGTWPSLNYLSGGGGVTPYFVASGRMRAGDPARLATDQIRPFSDPFPDFPCAPYFGFVCVIEYEGTNVLSRNRMLDAGMQYAGFVIADFAGPGLIARTIDVNRTGRMLVNAAIGQCVDVEGGIGQGRRVLGWTCHGGANQRVTVRGNEVRIGGRCLDLEAGNVNGRILLWDCHGGANQRWTVDAMGRLRNHVHGGAYCLTQGGHNASLRLAGCSVTNFDQRFVARH